MRASKWDVHKTWMNRKKEFTLSLISFCSRNRVNNVSAAISFIFFLFRFHNLNGTLFYLCWMLNISNQSIRVVVYSGSNCFHVYREINEKKNREQTIRTTTLNMFRVHFTYMQFISCHYPKRRKNKNKLLWNILCIFGLILSLKIIHK